MLRLVQFVHSYEVMAYSSIACNQEPNNYQVHFYSITMQAITTCALNSSVCKLNIQFHVHHKLQPSSSIQMEIENSP